METETKPPPYRFIVAMFAHQIVVCLTFLIVWVLRQEFALAEFAIAILIISIVLLAIAWYQFEPQKRIPFVELKLTLSKWLLPPFAVYFLLAGVSLVDVFIIERSYPLIQRIACCGFLLLSLTTLIGWARYLARSRTVEPGSEST